MMLKQSDPIPFKFKWVDEHGQDTGILKKRGQFDGETLQLDETEIPADSILGLETRENRMVLSVPTEDGQLFSPVITVFGTDIKKLKRAINGSRSDAIAKRERLRLQNEGRGSSYRDEICPHCEATILLTDAPHTPQVYCDYCDTLFTIGQTMLDTSFEQKHRICDECGMYSQPRKFTIFYFYFLLVIYGWYSDSTIRCPACMRPDAWKMLFGNIFGLIGVPVAIVQLLRAYSGRRGGGPLKGLDDANILARKGRIDEALSQYDSVMDNVPINAGVKFNIATGLVKKEEHQHAEAMYQMSLEDCSNYWPSVRGMMHVLRILGKSNQIEPLLNSLGLAAEDAHEDLSAALIPPEE